MSIASPIWGVLGDRYGRKPMLIRSMLGGAITVGLVAIVQTPEEMLVLRFLQGATSGTIAAATSLVAAETPRSRVGWALGVVTSAVALGGAIGPVVGGLGAALYGLRVVFFGGGVLAVIALIPVIVIVRESPRVRRSGPQPGVLAMLGQQPGLRKALAVLVASQGLVNVCISAMQQMVVLRLLEILSTGVAAVSGFGFGLNGIASSLAAIGYTRVSSRLGYVRTAAAAAVLLGLSIAVIGISPWPAIVVAALGLSGIFSGVIVPATASMIGLETPHDAQSTVFGFNASSVALGMSVGPLLGGVVAAGTGTNGVQIALLVAAALALLLAGMMAAGAREPAR
jgi:MFS family permease